MDGLALGLWVVTALGGLYMAGVLTRSGNRDSSARTSNLPSAAIFGHGTLGLIGLAGWAVYVSVGEEPLGWSLLGLLALIVGGGLFMFRRWWRDRREGGDQRLAEQQLPVGLVLGHGVLAVLTVGAVVATLWGWS
jgi:hypothetical protein